MKTEEGCGAAGCFSQSAGYLCSSEHQISLSENQGEMADSKKISESVLWGFWARSIIKATGECDPSAAALCALQWHS